MYLRLFCFLILFAVSAQARCQEILDFGDTEKTNEDPTYESNPNKMKQKNITFIIKNSQKGLLTGNKCLEDYTLSKGYAFLVQSKRSPTKYGFWKKAMHNLGANIKLSFKLGPHWKLAWKKKRKECREGLHDFVG